ncbi:ABC transporter permease [Aeromicrobium sp. CF4.19]|uniref:ABC transporter permease n=1 Tax=Aeromicrobium sp. CF4.19 TaxID=3373082 RepID=UPI003EE4C321
MSTQSSAPSSSAQSSPTAAPGPAQPDEGGSRAMPAGFVRNLGLVIALAVLCVVGAVTAGDRFTSVDNLMTVLRLASVLGVVSVGMTFVITGGGIDLSVGAVLALASVWATTTGTQAMADSFGWIAMVFTAVLVGTLCGVVSGVVIAYGKVVAFIATLAMLVSARGLAEILADRKTQIVSNQGFLDVFRSAPLGIPFIVIMFVVVAAAGWFLLNRTTFGRRTFAVGGNPEAARLAGIKVQRHTVYLYALAGMCAGIAAVMIMSRTTTGSSTHGTLLELDAIAAVVIGGTLLQGGRGTVGGTLFGVLILTTLTNVFTLNNLSTSAQAVATGVIIVAAVLLQQRVARRSG